jgi:predicted Zn-dependent peptidase
MGVTSYPEEKSTHSTTENLQDEIQLKGNIATVSTLPASIQHLSAEELADFKKKMIRKIDIRLMPMLIILFLLK